MSNGQGRFVTGSTLRHVTVMTLTGSVGLMFMFLVDFLALWWVSRLGDETKIAALGYAQALQFAVVSVSTGMMIATVVLVSPDLGRGERPSARRRAASALVLTLATQALVAALFWVFRREALALTGAEGAALDMAADFLRITAPSLPLIAIGMTCAGILRADGRALPAMMVTVSAGLSAAVFDPLLILWADLGLTGAAISIVIARGATAVTGLWFVLTTARLLARPDPGQIAGFVRPFYAIALPAIASQLATPFGAWVLTRAMSVHGDGAVAGWSVVSKLTILAFGGIFALSGAIGGIIGQNIGAGRIDRVQETYRNAVLFCAVYTLLVWLAMALAGPALAASFGLGPEGRAVVVAFCHWGAGAFVFTGALFVANAAFNNLGRPSWSMTANWLRDGVAMYPAALAGSALAGAAGVVFAQAVVGALSGIVVAWIGWRFVKGLRGDETRRLAGAQPVPISAAE